MKEFTLKLDFYNETKGGERQTKLVSEFSFPSEKIKTQKVNAYYEHVDLTLKFEGETNLECVELHILNKERSFELPRSMSDGTVLFSLSLKAKDFVSDQDLGEFSLILKFAGKEKTVGRLLRSRILNLGDNNKTSREHLESLLNVACFSRRGLILRKEFSKRLPSNSNHLRSFGSAGEHDRIQVIDMFLEAERFLERILEREIILPSRITKAYRAASYRKGMELDAKTLSYMASSNRGLALAASGEISFKGNNYRIQEVLSPVRAANYDIPENVLFLNMIFSLNAYIREMFEGLTYLENKSREFLSKANEICRMYRIEPRYTASIATPDRYLKTPSLNKLGLLIQRWNGYKNVLSRLDERDQYRASLPRAWLLWEYFCFEKLADYFRNIGFLEERYFESRSSEKRPLRWVSMTGADGEVEIFFDSPIYTGVHHPALINLRKNVSHPPEPDFVVRVTSNGNQKIGVLDAKFTPDPIRWDERGEEIWEKYGFWLKKPDGSNIDFCYAICPSTADADFSSSFDSIEASLSEPRMKIGILSLKVAEHDAGFTSALKNVFQQSVASASSSLIGGL